ncbi:MAG: phosphatase PAP2 family protein [Breoghania sp.]|nr:phosphatase PAP2 family protein [Breoghania sp.]
MLLAVGLAALLLDRPSHPWIHSLPRECVEFFRAITDIGKSNWILWSTGLYLLLTMAIDWKQVNFRLRLSLIWTYCAFIFFSVASSGLIALVLKRIIGRPRSKLFDSVGPLGFDMFHFSNSYVSFPSGHATTVAALATALCLIFSNLLWLIVVCGFWLVASRIMVGAHYPSDVIAGILLGMSVTLWTARYMAKRRLGFATVPGEGIKPIVGSRMLGRAIATAFSNLGRVLARARFFGGEHLESVWSKDNETQSDDR